MHQTKKWKVLNNQNIRFSKPGMTQLKITGPILLTETNKVTPNSPALSKINKLRNAIRKNSPWKDCFIKKNITLRNTSKKINQNNLNNSLLRRNCRRISKESSKSYLKSLLQAKKCLGSNSKTSKKRDSFDNMLLTNEYLNKRLNSFQTSYKNNVN